MNRVLADAKSILQGLLTDEQAIAVAGSGLCGIPEAPSAAPHAGGVGISNHALVDDFGLGLLSKSRRIRE